MTLLKTDLSKFDKDWYKPGKPFHTRVIWYLINYFLLSRLSLFIALNVFYCELLVQKLVKALLLNLTYLLNIHGT